MWFQKVARVAGAAPTALIAGRWASLWTYDGVCWPGGSAPGGVAAPTDATAGAMIPYGNPGGGRDKWLVQAWASGLVAGTLLIYDRLLHISGLNATTTTPQTVGGTLTRHTGGAGNFVFAEIYAIVGTTASAINLSSYTDQDGNAGAAGPAVVVGGTGYREVTRAIMLPLASQDYGVRAVANVDLTVTTGTAGNFGITVGHPICCLPIPIAGSPAVRDFAVGLPSIPSLGDDVCLAALWLPFTVTAPELFGALSFVEA